MIAYNKIKNIIIYCTLLVYSLHIQPSQQECSCKKKLPCVDANRKIISDNKPVVFNVNIKPIANFDSHANHSNENSNNITNSTQVITTITTNIHAWFKQQLTYIKSIDPKKYKNYCQSLLSRHKYKIIFYSILGSYGTLSAKIILDNHYLNQSDLWGMWQPSLSFDQLCEIPQKKLGRELILEIQRRYLNQ